jgi:hypothetical protein
MIDMQKNECDEREVQERKKQVIVKSIAFVVGSCACF